MLPIPKPLSLQLLTIAFPSKMDLSVIVGIIGVVATLLGGIISYHYPGIIENLNIRNSTSGRTQHPARGTWHGQWHSKWQTNEEGENFTYDEYVSITRKGNLVRLANHKNDKGYSFEATGRLVSPKILYGSYKAIPDVNSERSKEGNSGAFILLDSLNGIVGFFLGPDTFGRFNFGAWILARKRSNESKYQRNQALSIAEKDFYKVAPSLRTLFK